MAEQTDWVQFALKRATELVRHGRLREAIVSFMNDLKGRPGVPAFEQAEMAEALALQGKLEDLTEPEVTRFLDRTATRLKGVDDGGSGENSG